MFFCSSHSAMRGPTPLTNFTSVCKSSIFVDDKCLGGSKPLRPRGDLQSQLWNIQVLPGFGRYARPAWVRDGEFSAASRIKLRLERQLELEQALPGIRPPATGDALLPADRQAPAPDQAPAPQESVLLPVRRWLGRWCGKRARCSWLQ